MAHSNFGILGLIGVLMLAGCASTPRAEEEPPFSRDDESTGMTGAAPVTHAAARMEPASNSEIRGEVLFIERDGAVEIRTDLQGFKPNSIHAMHVHQFGDCSAPDASSAGGHFDPRDQRHGAPYSERRHAGDLGNIVSDSKGRVNEVIRDDRISLGGIGNSVLGRSMVIHENPDDFRTQPTGDAGGRISCGIIGVQPASYAADVILGE